MRSSDRLLALSFVESFSAVLLQRGIYFYTHDVLSMSETHNLALAVASGVTYAGGALVSHPLAARFRERRTLLGVLVLLGLLHAALALTPSAWTVAIVFPLLGGVQGAKWPLVESFVSAGHPPANLARVLGRFNMTWCLAIPLAMLCSGAVIGSAYPAALFVVAGALNGLSLLLASGLPEAPVHLEEPHAERPALGELKRTEALLGAARFGMLLSYALLFLLAPLLPQVLARLGVGVVLGATLSGLLDVARLGTFFTLGRLSSWRGRTGLMFAMIVLAPTSLALILTADRLLWLVLGEVCFGVAAATLYTAALYYAQVVKNASVEAGGAHESWIGVGFALGPASGLIGSLIESPTIGKSSATLIALSPLVLVFIVLSVRHLWTASAAGEGHAVDRRPGLSS